MKKAVLSIATVVLLLTSSSCGTLLGGKIGTCQKTKSPKGEPGRQVRGWCLVFDGPFIIVDAITGGLYMPCDGKK